jgi:preprotein translocase subunit SecA
MTGGGPLSAGASSAGVAAGAGSSAGGATAAGAAAIASGARGLPAAPTMRATRESLGDQTVSSGGGTRPGFTPAGQRIGRNDQCYCGSGLKYKKCHGK